MPTDTINVAALVAEREQIQQWLKPAQAREMEIRKTLVSHFMSKLTAPLKEGVNTVEADGYAVKFGYSLSRKLDEAALDAVMAQFPENSPYRQLGVLINYKPALVMEGYRSLDDQSRNIFEQAMTITEGAPTLQEIVPITEPATPIMDAYEAEKEKSKASRVHKTPVAFAAAIEKKLSKPATKPSKKGKK